MARGDGRGRSVGRFRAAPALAALCAAWAGLAAAAPATDSAASDYPAPAPSAASSGWEVSATPYLWVPGLKGDAGVSNQLPTVGLDLSSGDTLDMLHFGVMGRADARHDRFVAAADVFYVDLRADKSLSVHDREFGQAALKTRLFFTTVAAGYRLVDDGPASVDLVGGVRVVNLDLDLAVSGPRRSLQRSTSQTWIDPVVGARAHGRLGGRWSYSAYGDIGGFGVGSEFTWQASGTVDYRAGARWTLSAGWRHLDIDYAEAGFLYDAALDGPILNAAYRF
jgi:hypothetical protein